MNATLQSFSNVPPLREAMFAWKSPRPVTLRDYRDGKGEAKPRSRSRSRAKASAGGALDWLSEDRPLNQDDGGITTALHELMSRLWMPEHLAVMSPDETLQAVWQALPQFSGFVQHDAQEFVMALLGKITDEWGQYRGPNVVRRLCEGAVVSCVRCEHCQHVSTTKQPFLGLVTLEIPMRFRDLPTTSSRRRRKGDPCTLHDCLKEFTAKEVLEGSSAYQCDEDSCQTQRTAEKWTAFDQLPPVVIFHVNRTDFFCGGKKLTQPVHFPLEGLELGEYQHNPHERQGTVFDCTAVVEHHGRGIAEGHYTAYARNSESNEWYFFNDARVTKVDPAKVQAASSYLLFYVRRELTASDRSHRWAAQQWSQVEPLPPALASFVSEEDPSSRKRPHSGEISTGDSELPATKRPRQR